MANAQLGSKAVGSIVKLKVGGTATEFIVVHQGRPSDMYDLSCDGVWLLMKDIYEKRVWQSENINKYESSDIHEYLNNTFLNLFDSNIKDAIKQVKIPYRKNGGSGGTDQSGANGLSAKIFLLSGYEVGWTTSDKQYFPQDGAKLDYFNSGSGTSSNMKRIANMNGSAAYWWLRSPSTNASFLVWSVTSIGVFSGEGASSSYGIRPALILPSNVLVDDSGNVVIPDLTAHKTLVNGTAYTAKGGKCLVNGTSYDIKKGRTLIGGTGYDITFAPPYDPVFANNTWEQIIRACHNAEVPETWNVADQKPMTINGASYQVDIIGKNHDAYASGGKAPLTFQMHDCYGTKYAMNSSFTNEGGWTSCAMRSTHLPAIMALMPTEVQNGIREVNKLTSAGRQSATINTTADKLFLLSEIEIFGSVKFSKSGEGTQYDYYKAGNSKVKHFNGNIHNWWERSPYNADTEAKRFCMVSGRGTAGYDSAGYTSGVPFAFCF
nr:MAG TPA: tail protein [Caudoviricetes sp.]